MKKFFILIITLIFSHCLKAQELVIDPGMITTLVVCHSEQKLVFDSIKSKEKTIADYQLVINLQLEKLKSLEQKAYNALETVNSVVKNCSDIQYCYDVSKEIVQYQKEAIKLAANNPLLIVIAMRSETDLITRTVNLFTYITTAITGGEKNLLNNKERIDLIIYVLTELKVMRGQAFGVVCQMEIAQQVGILQTLFPGIFNNFKDIRKSTANNLINKYF